MASFKVEITSKEMIRPSSPTPYHLKTVPLSLIDQMHPLVYPSITFYYPKIHDHKNGELISRILKKSLSKTLVYYYPLAGRLEGNESINCNDEGVEFNEAYVSTQLGKVIENPNFDELKLLLPFGPTDRESIMLAIQLNRFSCGGVAISMCISHKIADAKSFIDFAYAWSTITRVMASNGNNNNVDLDLELVIKPPKFNVACHFPPRDLKGIYTQEDVKKRSTNFVTKLFVFDKKMMEELKRQVIDENEDKNNIPTRVEVVMSFIWKCMMEANRTKQKSNGDKNKIWVALILMDIRKRTIPNIPDDCYGNLSWFTIAPSLTGADATKSELTSMLRGAIRNINSSFIDKGLKNGDHALTLKEVFRNSTSHILNVCKFSSLCKFPLYDIDFGWGKPIWIGHGPVSTNNMAMLSSTSCGQGIEAMINLASEDHVALFQQQYRLLSQMATTKFSRL